MSKISKIILIVLFILLTASGCIKIEKGSLDGGVYKSVDGAGQWKQKTVLLSLPQESNPLDNVDTTLLVFDPQDTGTIYLGTEKDSLFVSFDAAESWERVRRLPPGKINAVAVDPKAKHIVYVAVENRIFKTKDANRTWENVYLEAMPNVEIISLAINHLFSNVVYAGLSDGRLIKSENSGDSWMNLHNFEGEVKQILINPSNAQIIYLLARGKGVYRSENQGLTWVSLKENYQRGNAEYLVFNPNFSDTVIIICDNGILHSENGGANWSEYKLVSSNRELKLYSLAIDPQNPDILYYTAKKTIYKSVDGGENWITRPNPSKRGPIKILIDPVNPNVIYLGMVKIEE